MSCRALASAAQVAACVTSAAGRPTRWTSWSSSGGTTTGSRVATISFTGVNVKPAVISGRRGGGWGLAVLAGQELDVAGGFPWARSGLGDGVEGGLGGFGVGRAAAVNDLPGGALAAGHRRGVGKGEDGEGRGEHGRGGVPAGELQGDAGFGGQGEEVPELGGGGVGVADVLDQGGFVDDQVELAGGGQVVAAGGRGGGPGGCIRSR
jgi:hypothetical protein